MKNEKDGGPAFPVPIHDFDDYEMHPAVGMSLRDYFAIQCLTQASNALQCRIYMANHNKNFNELAQLAVITDNMFRMAKDAYNMADAMLAEREEKDE